MGYRLLGWVTFRGIRVVLRRRVRAMRRRRARSGRRVALVALVLVFGAAALVALAQRRVAQAR